MNGAFTYYAAFPFIFGRYHWCQYGKHCKQCYEFLKVFKSKVECPDLQADSLNPGHLAEDKAMLTVIFAVKYFLPPINSMLLDLIFHFSDLEFHPRPLVLRQRLSLSLIWGKKNKEPNEAQVQEL